MRRVALGLVAASACTAALAAPLPARLDSPFLQHALARPFVDDLANLPLVIELLRQSGNEPQAELLERAEMRARVEMLLGRVSPWKTVDEAIGSEATAPPIDEVVAQALARVRVRPATPQEVGLARLPREALPVGPGVWTTGESESAPLVVPLVVTNDLAQALERIGTGIAHCQFEPGLAPGETRVIGCSHGLPLAAAAAAVRDFAARKPPFPLMWLGSTLVNVTPEDAYLERAVDWRTQARTQLADARCEDKGSCAAASPAASAHAADRGRIVDAAVAFAAVALAAALALLGFVAFRMWRRG